MWLAFGRKNHVTFTPYTQFCINIVSTTDNEIRAQAVVKLQRIAEEATDHSKAGDPLAISSKIETLLSHLQVLEQSFSAELSSHRKSSLLYISQLAPI